MGQSPFSRNAAPAGAYGDRRHSTRVDQIIPIVISGSDASRQPYREATETFSVSFHGAALKTRNQIKIGMQLSVENLMEGVIEKAICVRVAEPTPGQDVHAIAIQLLYPRNMWGVKNPPADWQSAAEAARQAPAAAPPAPKVAPRPPEAAAPVPAVSLDLEQRTADLIESALQLLRGQVAGILRESLKEFEDRLRILEAGAQARIIQYSEKTVADTESRVSKKSEGCVADAETALMKMRRELLEQLAARTERAIQSAEDVLHEKIAESFPTHQKP